MSVNASCFKKACDQLGVSYEKVGTSGVFYTVNIKGKPYQFIANAVPFNDDTVVKVANDKSYTYDVLSSVIRMPRTVSYLDPHPEDIYKPYVKFHSFEEIAEAILAEFSLPVIVKKNSGKRGENVFACTTREEVLEAVATIFNKKSSLYDHVLLAQQRVEIAREFRVIVFDGQIEMIYEKDISNATFDGNLSPLHWKGAKAVMINDSELQEKIRTFIAPLFTKLHLEYGGLDIALDANGELWLFELNVQPGYTYLLEKHDSQILVDLYVKMLRRLQERP